jgi:hypothetical protein
VFLYSSGLTYQKEERTEKGEKYFERAFAIKPALRKLLWQGAEKFEKLAMDAVVGYLHHIDLAYHYLVCKH